MVRCGLTPCVLCGMVCLAAVGCRSPYYADRGAVFGGLTGAGVGAIVGDAVGSTGTGAAIGAGVGALTGAAVGDAMDELAAENQAQIAATLGRPVTPGAATVPEVVAMSQAGVEPRLIVAHIRNAGVAAPLTSSDVIYLTQQQVPAPVIEAMQTPPLPRTAPPPAVVVEEHHYGPPPYWGPPRYRHACGPRASWGFAVHH